MRVYEYTYRRRKVAEVPATIRQPRDIAAMAAAEALTGTESEVILAIALDTKNHVIGLERVYTGNVGAANARIGELFRFAVRVNATGIILVHNHPSGDPAPSPDDLHLTAEVLAAGRLLDIELLDHLIVADGAPYVSLRERGIMKGERP